MNYQGMYDQNMMNQPNHPHCGCDNVTCLPPIVTRQVNVVHRDFIIEQPHICEYETKYCNHIIKKHNYCCKPIVSEEYDFCEENEGCCPKMFGNNGGMFFR